MYQNVFRGLDPETGRPDVDPARKPGTGKRADFCPGAHGGKNWPPIAFSPQTRMIYVPANNNMCGSITGAPTVEYRAGLVVHRHDRRRRWPDADRPGADHFGEVQAWNVDTGQKVWTHNYAKSPNWGSMLATAGGLVFSGGTNDRKIHAFDAATGKLSVGIADHVGHSGAADVVPGRRQAVHRRPLGLGRRLGGDAGDAQPAVSRRVSAGAGRRRRVGVRAGIKEPAG